MTRLTNTDIKDIGPGLEAYEAELAAKTGRSLLGLACHACHLDENQVQKDLTFLKTAVIPMTCGQGVLSGFSEAVRSIAAHLGCPVRVTELTDAGGLGEAVANRCELLLLADENSYLALHLDKRLQIDNDTATAQGFVAGLDLMAGGVAGKKSLVLGCGPVGRSAARALAVREAEVSLYDLDRNTAEKARDGLEAAGRKRFSLCPSLEDGLQQHQLIVEATPAAALITRQWIRPDMYIAAPGMPLGIEAEAHQAAESRILHDPLQIGTATMVVKALHEQKSSR